MILIENKTVRRRDKRIWYLLGMVFVAVFVFSFLVQRDKVLEEEVGAANLAKFDPGYIISDYQMSNYNSMNEAEIQAFLKSKNSCNDTNLGRYTAGEKVSYFSEMSPPRTWHIKDGHFVCMADETFEGGTAAHIIYKAAQDYKINPQVLLVLLEKEQSLVRDTFPHSQQYRSATGYGCPDTAACSSKYYGLSNQIRNAAALFRTVLDGGWTNYPLGENYVQYNPSAACGGSVVNIRNLATSALYRYTPYQPNAVTLAGGSDGCSAYGNLNFYRYFEDWFGGITSGVMEAKSKGYTIEDGTYRFISKASGKIITSKETIAGSKGDLFMKEGFSNEGDQFFTIKYEEDGYYSIINPVTGLAFDVKGAKTANSTHVGIFEPHSNCNQDWVFEKGDDGYYTIISRCSSRVLDATSLNNVVIFDNHNGNNQKWELVKVEDPIEIQNTGNNTLKDGTYRFISKASGKIITSKETIAGSKGDLFMKEGFSNEGDQFFTIKYEEDGYYSIINPVTGLAFDVKGAKTANSTHVGIFEPHSNCNQDWVFEKGDDGYYTIISRCSSRVLDATSLNNVVIFDNHNGNNQKWELVK